MRRFLSLLGVAAATVPVVIAVPVFARATPPPHPVSPHVADVALSPLPAVHGVVADTGAQTTKPFTLVGAAWHTGSLPKSATIQLRTRQGGHWSSWSPLSAPDEGPDDGSQDARAAAARHLTATDPLWVGPSDGVQARVVTAGSKPAGMPRGLHVVLVNGGSSGADAHPGPARPLGASISFGGSSMAEAEQAQPTIYTRAQWGADERLRLNACPKGPDYSSTIKMGFIHHTDGPNGYTAAQVPSILRSIYAYHVESNGWCDVGYNFLVDRFGRIWEGRYGGITKAVIGAHTGGFNANSFGVSMIGTFTSVSPSAALLSGVEHVFAWKLGMYYRDPTATTTLVAGSFAGSRYAKGTTVTFNTISGHRDADTTTCPGSAGYAKLPEVRTAVKSLIGAGFVAPSVTPSSVRMLSGQSFAIHAGLLAPQNWTATVTDTKTGATVKTLTGDATTAAVSTSWDGTGLDDVPAPPGTYRITLTGSDAAGSTNVPYTTTVTVIPPVTATGPATSTYGGKVTLGGVAAPNAAITVTLQPGAKDAPADVRSLTATSAGTWSTIFTANDDYTWSAATQGWSTPTSTTTVVPDVTSPAPTATRSLFVPVDGAVAISGTGLANTTFVPVTTPAGGKAQSGPTVTVGADGTWTGVSVKPSVPTVLSLQRTTTAVSAPVTVYPVAPPTATAPAAGYAQRAFTVTGNAGAPVSVQLLTRPAGASSYTPATTVTAAANGAYSVATTLPATSSATPMAWKVVSSSADATFGAVSGSVTVEPLFAPSAAASSWGYYRKAVTVTGKAVPGDLVTLWTKPSSGGTWTRISAVASNSTTGAFSRSFTLTRDTLWRVTSPTGTTASRLTYVRPSIAGPTRAKAGTVVYFSGYALPGQKVVVNRRPIGASAWRHFVTVTASSSGHWTTHFRLSHALEIGVGSHGHWSPVRRIRLA